MSIVKTIVEAHGGTIDVRSSPENGTRMMLRIPIRQFGSGK
jgi:signal transduction histidine kinase